MSRGSSFLFRGFPRYRVATGMVPPLFERAALPASGKASTARTLKDLALARFHFLGCVFDGLNDVLIPRAPAQVAGQRLADFGLRRVWICAQQLNRCENHSRSAKAALQPMFFPEPLLHWMQAIAVRGTKRGNAFDRCDFGARSLHGQHRA